MPSGSFIHPEQLIQDAVVAALKNKNGLTMFELRRQTTGFSKYQINNILQRIEQDGIVKKGAPRVCERLGISCETCWLKSAAGAME